MPSPEKPGARPEVWSPDRLASATLGRAVLLGSPARAIAVSRRLDIPLVESLAALPDDLETLVVVGGGTRIDEAKAWRCERRPGVRLVAVPSLWGSGAEGSPVAVLNRDGGKLILVGEQYLPDARCVFPELADSVPEQIARYACGDAWSHALEGFLSPLADEALRVELASLMREMLDLPLGRHPGWFEASTRACQGQARSSVGLVHGIAHTLEGPLRKERPDEGWGHARLCSLFLYPVMRFNRQASDKLDRLTADRGLDADALLQKAWDLFSENDFAIALAQLQTHWRGVLRDQCSRTNSTLVRPQSLSFFTARDFLP
jgi:alcohol dehydrogenase class IV